MSSLDAVLGDRRQRVAAAGDAERRRARRSPARWSRCRAANASNSNTPTGPFQTIVPAAAASAASDAGASSGRCRGSGRRPRRRRPRLTVAAASAANSLAVTTSTGIGTSAPRACIASITARASPTSAGSARLLPIGRPAASRKVLAMPPPTISRSTFVARLCRIVSLVETLRAGDDRHQRPLRLRRAPCVSASISAASSGPAQATGANSAMP